jgi:hypothetical protein
MEKVEKDNPLMINDYIDVTKPLTIDQVKDLEIIVPKIKTRAIGNNVVILMPYVSEYIGTIRKTDQAIEKEKNAVGDEPVLVLGVSSAITKNDKIEEDCKPKVGDFIHCERPSMQLLAYVIDLEYSVGLKDSMTGAAIANRIRIGIVDYYGIKTINDDPKVYHLNSYNAKIHSLEQNLAGLPPEVRRKREEDTHDEMLATFKRYWKVLNK